MKKIIIVTSILLSSSCFCTEFSNWTPYPVKVVFSKRLCGGPVTKEVQPGEKGKYGLGLTKGGDACIVDKVSVYVKEGNMDRYADTPDVSIKGRWLFPHKNFAIHSNIDLSTGEYTYDVVHL